MNHYQFFCLNDELFIKAVKKQNLLLGLEENLNSYVNIIKFIKNNAEKLNEIMDMVFTVLFKDSIPSTDILNFEPFARMINFFEASTYDVYHIVVKPYFPFKYQRLMKVTGASDFRNFVNGEDIAEFLEVMENAISELTSKIEKKPSDLDGTGWEMELETMRQGVADARVAMLDGFKDRLVIFT